MAKLENNNLKNYLNQKLNIAEVTPTNNDKNNDNYTMLASWAAQHRERFCGTPDPVLATRPP